MPLSIQTPKLQERSVFIGNKPFMNYVTSVVMQFTSNNAECVVVKARGKYISRAVDVAEISCKRFLEGIAKVSDVRIGSEQMKTESGRQVMVSTIGIVLKKIQFE